MIDEDVKTRYVRAFHISGGLDSLILQLTCTVGIAWGWKLGVLPKTRGFVLLGNIVGMVENIRLLVVNFQPGSITDEGACAVSAAVSITTVVLSAIWGICMAFTPLVLICPNIMRHCLGNVSSQRMKRWAWCFYPIVIGIPCINSIILLSLNAFGPRNSGCWLASRGRTEEEMALIMYFLYNNYQYAALALTVSFAVVTIVRIVKVDKERRMLEETEMSMVFMNDSSETPRKKKTHVIDKRQMDVIKRMLATTIVLVVCFIIEVTSPYVNYGPSNAEKAVYLVYEFIFPLELFLCISPYMKVFWDSIFEERIITNRNLIVTNEIYV